MHNVRSMQISPFAAIVIEMSKAKPTPLEMTCLIGSTVPLSVFIRGFQFIGFSPFRAFVYDAFQPLCLLELQPGMGYNINKE
jgi:hypothetical protein